MCAVLRLSVSMSLTVMQEIMVMSPKDYPAPSPPSKPQERVGTSKSKALPSKRVEAGVEAGDAVKVKLPNGKFRCILLSL